MELWDTAVIGAGASGLMAGIKSARFGARTVLLEGNPRPGKKLLAAGNGRCNLSNTSLSLENYRGDPAFISRVLALVPFSRLKEEFENLGLLLYTDSEGRVYPRSLSSASVLRTLWGAAEEAGTKLLTGFEVSRVTRERGGFLIESALGDRLFSKRLVLSAGGRAAPALSAKSGGYGIAKSLGHTVGELSPALSPLPSNSKLPGRLKGVRVRCRAALLSSGREVCAEAGEVIFGTDRLSGICILNLSSKIRQVPDGKAAISLDLLPEMTSREIENFLGRLRKSRPNLPFSELLNGFLPRRLGEEVIASLKIGEDDIPALCDRLKNFTIPVSAPRSWDFAQVTAGGISLSEVDSYTMESKICPGLYLAGEILSADGDCGGYNLHWAFSTGLLAGEAAARGLESRRP